MDCVYVAWWICEVIALLFAHLIFHGNGESHDMIVPILGILVVDASSILIGSNTT
jgi:hypothetical protein